MLVEINLKNMLDVYCKNKHYGCDWSARRNKILSFVRITTKKNKPDKIEFLERDKKRKYKDKNNVKYIKLNKPILILNDPNDVNKLKWYETEIVKTKRKIHVKNNKTSKF
jgi:hypothetical protein